MQQLSIVYSEIKGLLMGVITIIVIGFVICAPVVHSHSLPRSKITTEDRQSSLKNVLFIAIDDLRTELGTYGHKIVKSPNIDALAARSIVFERAYCQVAVCSPSRASLLTGRRPDTNHVWRIANDEYWRNYTNATSIPQYFKENGYVSIGMGKIFHPGAPSGNDDIAYSWSLPYFHSPIPVDRNGKSWTSFEGYKDDQLPDGQIANHAVDMLQEIKKNRTNLGDNLPFFLAVGFHKPHLPFHAPSKYYDMYPPAEQIDPPKNPDVPTDFPPVARGLGELSHYNDMKPFFPNMTACQTDVQASLYGKGCRVSEEYSRILRRAYYACISYTDAQVGRIISEMEALGFADETVIVLWADHGWQLGEHNHWTKHTNFEDATHVPFMIRVPGVTDKGIRTSALVELIDIFPSITELAGLQVPPMCPEGENKLLACVEGTSVTPLLKNPDLPWKKAAFSQYSRPSAGMTVIPNEPPYSKSEHGEDVMGYSLRVDQYHFIEWYRFNRTTATPNWSEIWGTELYNHTEPVLFFNDENVNLAKQPEMQNMVKELRKMIQDGWRAALPP